MYSAGTCGQRAAENLTRCFLACRTEKGADFALVKFKQEKRRILMYGLLSFGK